MYIERRLIVKTFLIFVNYTSLKNNLIILPKFNCLALESLLFFELLYLVKKTIIVTRNMLA